MTRWLPIVALAALVACSALTASAAAPDKKEKLRKVGPVLGVVQSISKDKTQLVLAAPAAAVWHSGERVPGGYRIDTTVTQWMEKATILLPGDTKVRIPIRPQVDARGKPVRASAAARPANDPDKKLGGIPGSLDDLAVGQVLIVNLQRNREGMLFATVCRVVGP